MYDLWQICGQIKIPEILILYSNSDPERDLLLSTAVKSGIPSASIKLFLNINISAHENLDLLAGYYVGLQWGLYDRLADIPGASRVKIVIFGFIMQR